MADLVKKYQPQQDEKDKIFESCINNTGGKEGFLKEYLNEAIKTVNLSDINSIAEFIEDRSVADRNYKTHQLMIFQSSELSHFGMKIKNPFFQKN